MSALSALSHPAATPSAPSRPLPEPDRELLEVAHALSGAYDNFEQFDRDVATRERLEREGGDVEDFYLHEPVRMHIVPLERPADPQGGPGQSFYVEQYLRDTPDQPYRQRVYHLTRNEQGDLVDRIYKIDDPRDLVGAWAHPEKLQALRPEKLDLQEGCDMTFEIAGVKCWHGESGAGGTCPSSYEGILIHSQVDLDAHTLVSLDQGRTPSGNLVFGPADEDGGYEFEKRSCYRYPGF